MDAAAALYCPSPPILPLPDRVSRLDLLPSPLSQREMQRFRLSRRLQTVLSETVLVALEPCP